MTHPALAAFDAGIKVFPCRPLSKLPLPMGARGEKAHFNWAMNVTREELQDYITANSTLNWAIYLGGSGLVAVDVDAKHNKPGLTTLAGLLAEHGMFPKTYKQRTPNAGEHYVFACPDYKGPRGEDALGMGVDIMAGNAYILLAGSMLDVQDNLVKYEVVERCRPAPLPLWIANLPPRSTAEPERGPTGEKPLPSVLMDTQGNIDRATAYLEHEAEPAIEGQHGDKTTFSVAARVKDFGISSNTAKQLLAEYYNPRCIPPWPLADLVKKVENAYTYGANPIGSAAPEMDFVVNSPGPKHHSLFEGTPPERQWIISSWLPLHEVSSLYGGGGLGKSLLAMQLTFSVGTGSKFLGLDTVKQPVLYVACEDTEDELHRRKNAIVTAPEFEFDGSLQDAPIHLWSRVGCENDIAREANGDVVPGPFAKELANAFDTTLRWQNGGLLILDTLSDVFLGDENTRATVNKFVKTHLSALAKRFNLTVLILAHPSRTGMNTGDLLSGSTAWENAVRNRLGVYRHKDNEAITVLSRKKSNYARRGEEMFLEWDAGRFRAAGGVEAQELAEANDILRGLFLHCPLGEHKLHTVARTLLDAEPHLFGSMGKVSLSRRIERVLANGLRDYSEKTFELRSKDWGKAVYVGGVSAMFD